MKIWCFETISWGQCFLIELISHYKSKINVMIFNIEQIAIYIFEFGDVLN
jgi:hypothetical protein